MASEIVMPRMGLTMDSGIVVNWLKQEGQAVKAGEPLFEIETDKTTVEVESLESGLLGKIIANPGDELPVGAVVGYLTQEGETLPTFSPEDSASTVISAVSASQLETHSTSTIVSTKVKASPAARRLAQKMGVGLADISGSGPDGRIVAWNVSEFAKSTTAEPGQAPGRISPVAQRIAVDLGVDINLVKGSGPGGTVTRRDVELAAQKPAQAQPVASASNADFQLEPFTRIQRVMAERMVQSFNTAPHFYLHVEADARQMVALRQQLLPRLEKRYNIHLTFTDLLVYFCAGALTSHPLLMAQWTSEGMKKFSHVHIGIAVETENGLVVPVIRDADKLGLVEIAQKRVDLAERARLGKLLPNEFEEGVFTITNLGMYHIDSFDAILNPPQSAILAVGQIKERALVENGQLIPAPTMNLSLSVDHRVLDGARAARFLNQLIETIETPGLSMA
ncbi:MAG: dihydrolipoamide acetyltransferase family protein [Chloroflexi bacterium]|nr:dihydrolipoamide acetyltransferase family protein [Chloroflexota bacterium]